MSGQEIEKTLTTMTREELVDRLEAAHGLYAKPNRPYFDNMKTIQTNINEHIEATQNNLYAAYILAMEDSDAKSIPEMIQLAEDNRQALAALNDDLKQRITMLGRAIERSKTAWNARTNTHAE